MITFDEYRRQLGIAVRLFREEAGLSMRKLGLMADVHHNQIFRIEHGKSNPSVKTLYLIAEALDVDVRDLMPQTERTMPNPSHYFLNRNRDEETLRKPDPFDPSARRH